MLHNGRYIKYLPIKYSNGLYVMKVKRSQENFSYFHNLFTSPTSPLYHIVEYLAPRSDIDLIDVHKDSDYYQGGMGKLQFKEENIYDDWCMYVFHVHTDIHGKQATRQEILTKYKRIVLIYSLLS